MYDKAEIIYCEKLSAGLLTPLAGEVKKVRQRLAEIKDTFNTEPSAVGDNAAIQNLEKKVTELNDFVSILKSTVDTLEKRVKELESTCTNGTGNKAVVIKEIKEVREDDDVDLFGSDSEEDEEADKLREERLAAYAAKKSKKPVLIAKSNIILDVKPWDDETDMKALEAEVRKIQCDGLLWGAAKLVPLAYGIHKLQISSIVEDDKVSVDWMQEQIEAIEDFVRSVDIAAFNKV